VDLRSTWQVVAGAVLVPLGLSLILLAWYGAAHTPYVQQQVPYLVSGAFAGLGCMVLGGLLFWAHWLYRIYDQASLNHREAVRLQREVVDLLGSLAGVGRPGEAVANGSAASYVATPTGANFHLADCPTVAGRRSTLRTVTPADLDGLRPCRICEPLGS
ncbi:MAG TPA: hypothetical protein VFH45_02065, partial [Acidimicrobiales bacterium]|nr:hypothetical protein [Acidimicrobiales bacterium]